MFGNWRLRPACPLTQSDPSLWCVHTASMDPSLHRKEILKPPIMLSRSPGCSVFPLVRILQRQVFFIDIAHFQNGTLSTTMRLYVQSWNKQTELYEGKLYMTLSMRKWVFGHVGLAKALIRRHSCSSHETFSFALCAAKDPWKPYTDCKVIAKTLTRMHRCAIWYTTASL